MIFTIAISFSAISLLGVLSLLYKKNEEDQTGIMSVEIQSGVFDDIGFADFSRSQGDVLCQSLIEKHTS
jgi:hypothetical protein